MGGGIVNVETALTQGFSRANTSEQPSHNSLKITMLDFEVLLMDPTSTNIESDLLFPKDDPDRDRSFQRRRQMVREFRRPHFPSVSMGWGSSTRTDQGDPFTQNPPHPFRPIVIGTPTESVSRNPATQQGPTADRAHEAESCDAQLVE